MVDLPTTDDEAQLKNWTPLDIHKFKKQQLDAIEKTKNTLEGTGLNEYQTC